jgi:hypothetical protein
LEGQYLKKPIRRELYVLSTYIPTYLINETKTKRKVFILLIFVHMAGRGLWDGIGVGLDGMEKERDGIGVCMDGGEMWDGMN